MDRPKKEIYCHMSLSILQKFVYILYSYEASVFKYHEMEKCVEQQNLIYRVSQKKVWVFDYLRISEKLEQLLHSNKLYFILEELT